MYGSVRSPELTLRWFARRARLPFSHKLLAVAACTTVLALAACGGARTVERQDELRGVWLGVRALGAEAAHGVGEGELPDRRAGDHVVGAASCSEVSQVAVKCRATLLCATPLNLCLADLSRTRRESFVACRCSRAAVYPIAWEKLRLMRLGCGDGSGCEACWCASCESSGG